MCSRYCNFFYYILDGINLTNFHNFFVYILIQLLFQMFERESRREKILEARNREIRLKLKQTKQTADVDEEVADEEVESVAEGVFHDNLVQQAETEFYQTIEKELAASKPPVEKELPPSETEPEIAVPQPKPEPQPQPEPEVPPESEKKIKINK